MLSNIINEANRGIVREILNSITQYIRNDDSTGDKIRDDSEVLEYVTELLKYPEYIYDDIKDAEEGVSAVEVSEKIVSIHYALKYGDIYTSIGDILNYLPDGPFARTIINRWTVDIIMANRKK